MEQSETPDLNEIRRERLSHYFTTADKLPTGNAHRDEHILRLYESAEKSKAFIDIEDALGVFALATAFLWEYRLEPFDAINAINNLFTENNLTPIQQRILLTHLADYAKGSQRTVHIDEIATTISLDKIARFLMVEREKIPDPTDGGTPFALSNKTGAKVNLIRVLNALHEEGLIVLRNGDRPSKKQFVVDIGAFLGVDLVRFESDLEQAFSNSVEVNVKIFDTMMERTKKAVIDKLNNPKK